MGKSPILSMYLGLFFEAWKKGYKLGWIYYRMVENFKEEETLAFFASAKEHGYPLVPEAYLAGAGTPFFLATVNKGFSDWMYRVNPTPEKFTQNALTNSRALQASKAKWEAASRACSEDLRQRGWEALDSFGGETKGLKRTQLKYDARGRRTGKGMSEKTWAK